MSLFSAKSNALLGLTAAAAICCLASAFAMRPAPIAKAETPREKAALESNDAELLKQRHLAIPVQGMAAKDVRDTFDEGRGLRKHEALDLLAPRGTPVVAVDDGRVAKLFRSLLGGITVYQFDRDERFIYYYAHLEGYADGLKEGAMVKRGDVLGYVGTSGNAPKNTPHLHFTIFRAGPDKKWWKGTAVNPYPYLTGRG